MINSPRSMVFDQLVKSTQADVAALRGRVVDLQNRNAMLVTVLMNMMFLHKTHISVMRESSDNPAFIEELDAAALAIDSTLAMMMNNPVVNAGQPISSTPSPYTPDV